MLFRTHHWTGLADGSITVAFRYQKRPSVKAGGTLRTRGGFLAIDAVDRIERADIDDESARRAGYASAAAVLADLGSVPVDKQLYRMTFHCLGDDPRVALRADDVLDPAEIAAIRARLDRLDRAAPAPWTRAVLRLIADNPAVVSTALAPQVGMERPPFKRNVRKLKALGLTESLEVGYRLSPRGAVVLGALDRDG